MELPIAFENRMKRLLGAEYADFYRALTDEQEVKGLRVNSKKLATEAFLQASPFPTEPLSYVTNGFIVSEEAHAGKHPYHHAGAYYMQDPGAMATVAALPNDCLRRKNLKVLDLCAAPGGKTTQVAAQIAERGGAVLANEYNAARSRILAGNVERMGLDNVCVTNLDSKYIAAWYPAFFDLVLVDAPCSGEGMFRKNNPALAEWSPQNVAHCAERQAEILANAARCVGEGGYLLYSTCTYATEENEETVAAFLRAHPDFSLCPCAPEVVAHTANGVDALGGMSALALCRRFYPHLSPGEGQFAALLQRTSAPTQAVSFRDSYAPLSKADRVIAEAFLKDTVSASPTGLCYCGGLVSAFSAHDALGFHLPPFGVISVGASLGEVRKGRLVPHHHFFSAYGTDCRNQILLSPEDPLVSRYLAGEEIEAPTSVNGFSAVLLRAGDACVALGGGKSSGGKLKNYYPKGLRSR